MASSTRTPEWDDEVCLSEPLSGQDEVCFEIHDGYTKSAHAPYEPILLHSGCSALLASQTHDQGEQSIDLDNGATLFFRNRGGASSAAQLHQVSPPVEAVSPCTSPWCQRCDELLADVQSPLYDMFGKIPNVLRGPEGESCWQEWDDPTGTRYWQAVADATNCDLNWFEGALRDLDFPDDRPEFTHEEAPALLGFDEDIFTYCSAKVRVPPTFFSQKDLAERCVEGDENILRIIRSAWPWTMCQNLAWEVCALRGLLPGQGGRRVHFATAPKELDPLMWEHPTDWPCGDTGCGEGQYATSAVFFAEVCVMRKLCRNSDAIFKLEVGQTFECDLSSDALGELRRLLQTS